MANKFTVYQGNTTVLRFTITDQDGTAVNLTGHQVILTIYNGTTLVYTDTNSSHTTAASGITTFTIPKTDTDDWAAPNVFVSEIEVLYSDGARFTASRDVIEVIKDLT